MSKTVGASLAYEKSIFSINTKMELMENERTSRLTPKRTGGSPHTADKGSSALTVNGQNLQPGCASRVLVKAQAHRDSQMDAAQFHLPIRILTAEGEDISEIYSAEEALEFLFRWPRRIGPVYEDAVSACLVATIVPENTEEAQRAFAAFARVSGILAKDMAATVAQAARVGALRG